MMILTMIAGFVRRSAARLICLLGLAAIVRAEGVELDKPRQTEEDGRLDVVLHFKPLPRDTKVFDFIEGDTEGAF